MLLIPPFRYLLLNAGSRRGVSLPGFLFCLLYRCLAQVLDVTSFLSEHPGGELAILTFAGKDATEEFNMTLGCPGMKTLSDFSFQEKWGEWGRFGTAMLNVG